MVQMSETVTTIDQAARLRDYVIAKQEVTAIIRTAEQQLRSRGDTERAEEFHALVVKLAEDRFNLAVVGQFKRGKSSLMNAIIGRDLLPTGLLPLTSAITTLCYGPEDCVILKRQGWALTQEIALDELADYVTERGNPGNEKGVIEARVELPVAFLRRGLYFIDTPGVGSARQENTATTYAFLPQADAVIFVTSVEAPLSEAEEEFLRDIRAHVRKLFVVVNKMDLLAPTEREEVLGYVRTGVAQVLETGVLRLYPLSAREGLVGKLDREGERLQQSGLLEFEAELTSFLAQEQGRTFLVAILDRAVRLLIEQATEHDPSGDAVEARAELESVRARMESVRATFVAGELLSTASSTIEPITDTRLLEQALALNRTAAQQVEARRLVQSATCAICDAQLRAVFEFFSQWQFILGTNAAAQREFATARGFCHFHTWQFQQMASPHGLSAGYAPLVETAVAELRQSLGQPAEKAAALIGTLLPSTETCAACRVLRETEIDQLEPLLAQFASAEGRELYAQSHGLCLPHLRLALKTTLPDEVANFLLAEQVRRMEEISEDMRSYTLKRDALRRGLLNANEEHAWRRALVNLTGERNVGPFR